MLWRYTNYYTTEIGKEIKNENFENLIIVTDGQVDTYSFDKSD